MLKQLSRLEKTRNTILLGIVILMVVSLIIFYAPSNSDVRSDLTRSQEPLAAVGNEVVTVGDVAFQRESLARRYAQFGGAGFTPPVKGIIDGEINGRLVRQEAARLNLTPTDEELAAELRRQLKVSGFDTAKLQSDEKEFEKYRRFATENFGGIDRLEQTVRDGLAEKKLNAYLTSGVSVSEDEVLENYRRTGTSFDIVYVPVTVPAIAGKLQPSDAELQTYFDKYKANYYISSPQKKIRYLFINQAKVGEKLDIPDAELQTEYNNLSDDKKQKGFNVQQIVLKIAKPELENTVRTKADDLVAQARKDNNTVSEEDFANLARGNSEDTRTAANGGRIAGFVRPNPNKPDDPLQKTLTLEAGQVTDPIKYNNSYYIFRRGETVPKSYEEAKPELLVSLRNRRAYNAAAEIAGRAVERLREVKDVQKVAEELAPAANMTAAEMVRETNFIKPGDDVPNVGVSPQFETGIEPLQDVGQVGDRTPIRDGFAVPLLVEKREPRDAELSEVREQVAAAVKLEQARGRLQGTADELVANSNSLDGLRAAAKRAGLEVEESKQYKLGTPLGAAGSSTSTPELEDAVYNLQPGEVIKKPITDGQDFYVIGLVNRTDADLQQFAKQRDTLVQGALAEKRGQVFDDYLADLRARTEKAGNLKIYDAAVAKLNEKTPEIPT